MTHASSTRRAGPGFTRRTARFVISDVSHGRLTDRQTVRDSHPAEESRPGRDFPKVVAMSAQRDEDCLFCRIVAGEIPADVVHETETTLAFRDINPQAPTHILVIPRTHQPNVATLAGNEPDVLVDLVAAVADIAEQEGLGKGYRLVFNTGRQAYQSVFHVHAHLLGGRDMGWPPG